MPRPSKPANRLEFFKGHKPSDWTISASIDQKGRLTINKADLDDDWYIHISVAEVKALKRVLDRECKPRSKSGDAQLDVLQMLSTLFGGDAYPAFLNENGVAYSESHWLGG